MTSIREDTTLNWNEISNQITKYYSGNWKWNNNRLRLAGHLEQMDPKCVAKKLFQKDSEC